MLRRLKAWWIVITQMGPVMRVGRQIDEFFRYHVLTTLAAEGLFEYLKETRSYGQILAEFGFVDNSYTRLCFDVLASDNRNMLIKDDSLYRVNPEQTIPEYEQVATKTDKRFHSFTHIAEGMVKYIPPRMRNQPIELAATFEQDGRQLLARFDATLGNHIYTAMRSTAFAILTPEDRESLNGKQLLDVGCGSGRETAEIWLHLKGNIRITAIDPVPALLEVAAKNFSSLLDEISPNHPPLNETNQPVFKQASATHLPFKDNTFDAVFYSQILHWTSDPRKAIKEIVRVVKPGGLVFGTQGGKPQASPYMDMVFRTNENCSGFFWMEEYRRWYGDLALVPEIVTPVGAFRVHKKNRIQAT